MLCEDLPLLSVVRTVPRMRRGVVLVAAAAVTGALIVVLTGVAPTPTASTTRTGQDVVAEPAAFKGEPLSVTVDPWPEDSGPRACPAPQWPEVRPGEEFRRVLVVGDSLTQGSRVALERELRRRGWLPSTRCWAGESIAWGVEQVREAAALDHVPATLVVSLGTNDVFAGRQIGPLVDEFMRSMPPNRTVYWVSLSFDSGAQLLPVALQANEDLESASERWPLLEVIDVDTGLRLDAPSSYFTDSVHLTRQGYRVRSAAIAAAMGLPRPQ